MIQHHLSTVWSHLTQITPKKGKGIYLYDHDNKKYIDFTSGIGVTNTGHCHPEIVKAIQKQSTNLIFGQINTVISDQAVKLSNNLNSITPKSIDSFFLSNSGAEAVEASVKLAKQATKRSNIIVFQGSFHGRTHLAMAMTSAKTGYRLNYQPLPSGIFIAPYPSSYYYGWSDKRTSEFCLKQLKLILKSQTAPEETAAIIIEPILGEGGYIPAPSKFMKGLRKICDDYGILLIVDEVQSGFGRTGKMFCFEHHKINPDIIVMAKGLGSGLPISAIGASNKLMKHWIKGTHGGTYGGGSTIPIAAANATIDTIINEGLLDNAKNQGDYFLNCLNSLKNNFSFLGNNRGKGLMIGTEFTDSNGNPGTEIASEVQKGCIDKGLLLLTCGTYLNIIRWIPPLIVSKKEIDKVLEIFSSVVTKYKKEKY